MRRAVRDGSCAPRVLWRTEEYCTVQLWARMIWPVSNESGVARGLAKYRQRHVGDYCYARGVNRTDRLYALVEELRSRAPRLMRASELAARFEVTTRTIERDLLALQ